MTQLIIPEVADLAAAQDGVVSAADLARLGLSPEQIRHRTDHGWLRRILPRVFTVAGSPDSHARRLRAGLLCLGDESWVSYEAAAALHGLDRSDDTAVEFTIDRRNGHPPTMLTVHTSERWHPLDTVSVRGFRATSATRTLLDLAHARASRTRVAAAMDSAVRLGLTHPAVLATRLTTLRGSGRWGCRLVEGLLPDAGGHSPLERTFLEVVRSIGVGRPDTQVVQRSASGRHIARVDFLFPDQALVVEVNGRRGHVSDTERTKDAQRRNELQHLGFRVVEYTTSHLRQRRWWVAEDLRRHLAT